MYYIYSRKSKYTGKGESIENQIEICREYLRSHIKDIDESEIIVYEDEGFSAKNLHRPMFKKMIADSKKEKIKQILVDGKSKQMFKLTVISDEAELVKLIFKKFLQTNSLTKVETYLLQNNIKSKNGKAFTRFTIKNILENPVYMVADELAFTFFENNGVEFSEESDVKSKFDGKHGIMSYNKTIQKEGKRHYTREIKD